MRPVSSDHGEVQTVLDRFQTRTGIVVPESRRNAAMTVVRGEMERARCASAEAFLRAVETDRQAYDALVQALTVAETYFFRDPRQFDAIREHILPEILANRPDVGPIHIWSAGCASGEEPYSLAILMEEEGIAERARIVATDISAKSLEKARGGEYTQWSLRGCHDSFVDRYFTRRRDRYVVLPRLRKQVRFAILNLAEEIELDQIGAVDLIVCRNVMIYFDAAAVRRTTRRLYASLTRGGWLVTGPSDPPLWEHAPFEIAAVGGNIFYRRESLDRVGMSAVRPAFELAAPSFNAPWVQPEPEPADCPLSDSSESGPALMAENTSAAGDAAPPAESAGMEISEKPPALHLAAAEDAFKQGEYRRVVDLTEGSRNLAGGILRIRALANLGKMAEAQEAAADIVADHPFSIEARHLAAVIALGAGCADEAVAQARAVIYLDRTSAVGHMTLGAALRAAGDTVGARRCYRNGHALCAQRPADEVVPLSDGERAGRLAEAARAQLAALQKEDARR